MTRGRQIPAGRYALAIGLMSGIVGCQHLGSSTSTASRSRTAAPLPVGGSGSPAVTGPEKKITAAQEADVQIALARTAEQRGDLEQAMAAYQAALTRDKSRADAHLRLAILHDQQGKFRESADLYRRALELKPGDPDIYCDIGYSLYLQHRWEDAERNLRQAIVLQPDHARAHNNLALVLAHDNRLDEALVEFQRAGSGPAEAHDNLSFALTLDGRWDEAREHYRRALDIDPSSQVARARLAELNTLTTKLGANRRDTGTVRDEAVMRTSFRSPQH